MIRPLALAAALACAALPLQAQDNADALRDAATRYVENPVQQRMMDDMLSADALVAQMRAMMPELSDEQLEIIGQIGAEEMAAVRPELEVAMIEAAVETFTLEEIVALEEFYSTPVGASVMGKMQPFMQSAMTQMAPAMQAAQAGIMSRVVTALQ